MFQGLLHIKHSPCASLPTLRCLLDRTLQETVCDATELLTLASSRQNNQCRLFESDYFLKIVVYCDGLDKEEYETFTRLFHCALCISEAEVEQFPSFLLEYKQFDILLCPELSTFLSTTEKDNNLNPSQGS